MNGIAPFLARLSTLMSACLIYKKKSISQKRYTPPQSLNNGDRAFRRRRRPCSPSNRLEIKSFRACRAAWAPPNHAEYFSLFILRMNESDKKWGVT